MSKKIVFGMSEEQTHIVPNRFDKLRLNKLCVIKLWLGKILFEYNYIYRFGRDIVTCLIKLCWNKIMFE